MLYYERNSGSHSRQEQFESFHAKMKTIKSKKYNQESYPMKSCVKNSHENQNIAVSSNC